MADDAGDERAAEERWSAITRDLRRTTYLAAALDIAAADVELAVAAVVRARSDGDTEGAARARTALRAAVHYHLGAAWDDGAGSRADLLSALDVARTAARRLDRQVRDLLRRVSDQR